MKLPGVYALRCLVTNKVYVGSSVYIRGRWKDHRVGLNSGTHRNSKLLDAWKEYGSESFIYEILEVCNPEDRLKREQFWIDKLDAYNNGYNMQPKATGGRPGPKSPEWCAKLAASVKGFKHTPETCAKMSALQKGKPSKFKGKKHSEKTRKLMSKQRIGRPRKQTSIDKTAAYHRGRPKPTLVRKKVSAGLIAYWNKVRAGEIPLPSRISSMKKSAL